MTSGSKTICPIESLDWNDWLYEPPQPHFHVRIHRWSSLALTCWVWVQKSVYCKCSLTYSSQKYSKTLVWILRLTRVDPVSFKLLLIHVLLAWLKSQMLVQEEPHANISSLCSEFQWLSRLPVTGELDGTTLRLMLEPRCGVSDEGSQQIWAHRVNTVFTGKSGAAGRPQRRRKRSATEGVVCVKCAFVRHHVYSELYLYSTSYTMVT